MSMFMEVIDLENPTITYPGDRCHIFGPRERVAFILRGNSAAASLLDSDQTTRAPSGTSRVSIRYGGATMGEEPGSKFVGVVCLRCGLRTLLEDSHHGRP